MSFLRRHADASPVAPGHDGPLPRLTRAQRKELKKQEAAAAELAARIARAQRRLAQATGPIPVVPPRRSHENAIPSE